MTRGVAKPAPSRGLSTLRQRIFWSVVPVLLLLWVAQGALDLHQHWQLVTREFMKRGEAMAGNLAYSSELGVFAEDQQLLETSLRGVIADPDVAYVFLYGEDGTALAKGGAKSAQLGALLGTLSAQEEARLLRDRQPFTERTTRDGTRFIEFFTPILSQEMRAPDELLVGPLGRSPTGEQRVIGAVRLGLSLENLERHLVELIQLWGGLTIVLLAVTALAIYTLSRRITRPVKRLTDQAKKIADGFLDEAIPIESRDEIGQLAVAFNQMARDLKKTIDDKELAFNEVRELNRTLEDRIRERTAELEERTLALQRSLEEVRAMAEISHALSSSLDFQWVLDTIGRHAVNLSQSDGCAIFEYNPARGVHEVAASQKLGADFVQAIEATPIAPADAVISGPFQLPDVTQAKRYAYRDITLREGFRAVLVVPMAGQNTTRGVVLFRCAPGPFSQQIVDFLLALANQSKVAIDNARLFQQVQSREVELEKASQHKSQFLANMSHELRTPLNAILGYTELVLDNLYGEVPERMREVLERVDHNGRHLLGLINDVLDLSKIEAGQIALSLTDYSMKEIVHSVFTAVESLAAEKNLALKVSIADDLPTGRGDERRLTQVLMNLVGNAIKFTDAGEVALDVTVVDSAFVVAVSDTGPGISEADQEEIFKEFHQADNSATRKKGGSGLGLSISRKIVDLHGGRLWVESNAGKGSTFFFSVPVRVAEQIKAA